MPVQRSTNLSKPQKMAPRLKLDWNMPYFGSLDTTSDPSNMNDLDSPDNLNVVYDVVKSVKSRAGYTKLLTTKLANPIQGMYSLYQSSGARQLVYQSGRNWYIYNNAGGSTLLTGTPTNFTANQQWSLDEYQDNVYGGNSKDGLIAYNGSTYSIANSGITPQYVKIHKNRVYCANANSSTLYFSDAANPGSFPANNFININTNDGQNITGISEMLDNLNIFKDDSIWILTGEPLGAGNTTTIGNLQLRRAQGIGGCSAFRTIQTVGMTTFFMHHTGIYALQNYSITLVSPFLSNTFKNGMNQNAIGLSWGLYSDQEKKYYLGYPSAGSNTPDSVIVYDFLTKGFSRWDDVPVSCAVSFKFSGTNETICAGDTNQGNIYELNQGNADIAGDNGTVSSATNNTLTDTTKNWTVNQFADCRVGIVTTVGTNTVTLAGTVLSNTATTLTLTSNSLVQLQAGQTYTIGYFISYWKSKNFDFEMVAYTKKYRFLGMFVDTETYPIQFGYSIDFQLIGFQKAFQLASTAPIWGQFTWGKFIWGANASEFGQANIAGTGRYVQIMFGNYLANQPWRVVHYMIDYKLKKIRPNIVTT